MGACARAWEALAVPTPSVAGHGHADGCAPVSSGPGPALRSFLRTGYYCSDAEQISHIAFGFMASKALFAALDIALFENLSGTAMTVTELAHAKYPSMDERWSRGAA